MYLGPSWMNTSKMPTSEFPVVLRMFSALEHLVAHGLCLVYSSLGEFPSYDFVIRWLQDIITLCVLLCKEDVMPLQGTSLLSLLPGSFCTWASPPWEPLFQPYSFLALEWDTPLPSGTPYPTVCPEDFSSHPGNSHLPSFSLL